MVRIFVVNLVRSILFCVAAFVVAAGVDIGAAYLTRALFRFEFPFWMCIILSGVVSAGVFSLFMKWGEDTDAILPPSEEVRGSYFLERAARGKHVKFIAVWASLLIHLVLGAVAVWLYFQFGESIAALYVEPAEPYLHTGMYFTEALSSVAVVQIAYFFAYWAHYKKIRCPKCKNVHCFVYAGERSVREDVTYDFEPDEKSSKHVSVVLDGVRFESTGYKWYQRKNVSRQTSYARRCVICGGKSYEYLYQHEKGSWEREEDDD